MVTLNLKYRSFQPALGNVLSDAQWKQRGFARLPRILLISDKYKQLTFPERDLLLFLVSKYNGHNNGRLTAPMRELRNWGWKKHADRLRRNSLARLEALGFIHEEEKFRYGHAAEYLLTWIPKYHVTKTAEDY